MGAVCSSCQCGVVRRLEKLLETNLGDHNYESFGEFLELYDKEYQRRRKNHNGPIENRFTALLIRALPVLIRDMSKIDASSCLRLNKLIKSIQKDDHMIYHRLELTEELCDKVEYDEMGQLAILNTLLQNHSFVDWFLKDNQRLAHLISFLTKSTTISSVALEAFETLIDVGVLRRRTKREKKMDASPLAIQEIFTALKEPLRRRNTIVQRNLYRIINKVLFSIENRSILHAYVEKTDHFKIHLNNFFILKKRTKVDVFDVLKLFIANTNKNDETHDLLYEHAARIKEECVKMHPLIEISPQYDSYVEDLTHINRILDRYLEKS